jgi:hypothetical protein
VHVVVFLLAFLEHFEDEVAADGRVVSVTKVLVDALLEGFDAFADFLGVVGVYEFFEDGARVRGALGNGLGAGAGLAKEGFGGFNKFLVEC